MVESISMTMAGPGIMVAGRAAARARRPAPWFPAAVDTRLSSRRRAPAEGSADRLCELTALDHRRLALHDGAQVHDFLLGIEGESEQPLVLSSNSAARSSSPPSREAVQIDSRSAVRTLPVVAHVDLIADALIGARHALGVERRRCVRRQLVHERHHLGMRGLRRMRRRRCARLRCASAWSHRHRRRARPGPAE